MEYLTDESNAADPQSSVEQSLAASRNAAMAALIALADLEVAQAANLLSAIQQLLKEQSATAHWVLRARHLVVELRAAHHAAASELLLSRALDVMGVMNPCNCRAVFETCPLCSIADGHKHKAVDCKHRIERKAKLLDDARAERYANAGVVPLVRAESVVNGEALEDLEVHGTHFQAVLDLLARFYALSPTKKPRRATVYSLAEEFIDVTVQIRIDNARQHRNTSWLRGVQALLVNHADRLINRIERLPNGSRARERRRSHLHRLVNNRVSEATAQLGV